MTPMEMMTMQSQNYIACLLRMNSGMLRYWSWQTNRICVRHIADKLSLGQLRNRNWHIQGTSAATGDGLY